PLEGLASLAERLGRTAKAEELFERLAREKKKSEDVLPLALFYGRHNRPVDGLRICEQARETCPPDQVAFVSVAVLRAEATTDAQRDSVEEWLKYAIKNKPSVGLRVFW